MVSLWDVADDATAAFMAAFYQRLERGEDRAEALRRVQLAMAAGHPAAALATAKPG